LKALPFISGDHGLDYYCDEELACQLTHQLQAKFKFQAIFENRKIFGRKKL
jgi:hypothetical protein